MSFLTNYLQVSNYQTLIFLALLAIFMFLVFLIRKVDFTKKILISISLGIALGIIVQIFSGFNPDPTSVTWVSETSKWYSFIGGSFMDLLRMIIIPLVFLSIIKIIVTSKENISKSSGKIIGFLLITTAISAFIGIILTNTFNLGISTEIGQVGGLRETDTLIQTLRNLIPKNPVQAMIDNNVIGVIIFAGFFGAGLNYVKKNRDITTLSNIIEILYDASVSVVNLILEFMPYAVIALIANVIAASGIDSLYTGINFMLVLYLGLVIIFAIHLLIVALNGVNVIKYLKAVSEALVLAFSSRSSLGTLPATVSSLKKAGVDEGMSGIAASLGANIGMNACAGIYPAMAVTLLANMVGIQIDLSFIVMLLVVISLSSIGIAGIPGTATIALTLTLSGMGMAEYFPLLGAIIAIDPIIDMGRTMINVSGAMASAVTVANMENKLNK